MTRILVAEDEPGVAMALEDDLRLESYEVHLAANGETALQRGLAEPFDLIILDIMLPGCDGLEVCRTLRRAGIRTPLILLTARAQEADKVLGLDIGADDYVTKPFSPRELRARIRAILRRAVVEVPERWAFGELEVDFERQEVNRDGIPIKMTPLEFKLLSAFIHHRGRVLSRERLIDQVWGVGTAITDRVIDTHVTNLRKKIEPVPSEPRYLVSVRGSGYRFDG